MSRHDPIRLRLAAPLVLATLLLAASLAHAGPATAGTASRADAIARGFGGSSGGEPELSIDGRWLAGSVMLATAGVAVGIGIRQFLRWHRRRRASVAGVEAVISRTLRLSRHQRHVLRHAAAKMGVEHPSALLLCPSLLRKARVCVGPAHAPAIDLILSRLGT